MTKNVVLAATIRDIGLVLAKMFKSQGNNGYVLCPHLSNELDALLVNVIPDLCVATEFV